MKEDDWIDVFVNEPSIESMKIAADWFEEQEDSAAQLLRWMITIYEKESLDSGYHTFLPGPNTTGIIIKSTVFWWWTIRSSRHLYYPHDLPSRVRELCDKTYPSPQEAWKVALRACREVMQRDGCIE